MALQKSWRKTIPPWKLCAISFVSSLLTISPVAMSQTALSIPVDLFYTLYNASYYHLYNEPISPSYLAFIWGLTVSTMSILALPAYVVAYPMANYFGRKTTMMLIPNLLRLTGVFFCVLFRYVNAYHLFILGQAFLGFSFGVQYMAFSMYLIEISPIPYRGFVAAIQVTVHIWSVVWVHLSVPSALGNEHLWPWLVALPAIPAIIQILLLFVMPESPQFVYIARQQPEKARRILTSYLPSEQLVDDTMLEIYQQSNMEKDVISFRRVLSIPHVVLSIILAAVCNWTQDFCGYTVLMSYSALTFRFLGFRGSIVEQLAVTSFWVAIPTTLVAPYLVERIGRRPMLLRTLEICFLCCVLVFIFSFFAPSHAWARWMCVCAYFIIRFVYALGPGPVPGFIGAETTAERVRSVATALGFMLGSLSTIFVQLLYPVVLLGIGAWTQVVLAIVPLACALLFLYFFMPETKNKPITEIVHNLDTKLAEAKRRCGCWSVQSREESDLLLNSQDWKHSNYGAT